MNNEWMYERSGYGTLRYGMVRSLEAREAKEAKSRIEARRFADARYSTVVDPILRQGDSLRQEPRRWATTATGQGKERVAWPVCSASDKPSSFLERWPNPFDSTSFSRCYTLRHRMVHCGKARYSTAQHRTEQYITVHYITLQYSTADYSKLLVQYSKICVLSQLMGRKATSNGALHVRIEQATDGQITVGYKNTMRFRVVSTSLPRGEITTLWTSWPMHPSIKGRRTA